MGKPTKRSFSFEFEFKVELVRRFLAGDTAVALAREVELSSPKPVETWARTFRNEGEDWPRPKPRGRPRADPAAEPPEEESARLRRENERLRAEVAYLG